MHINEEKEEQKGIISAIRLRYFIKFKAFVVFRLANKNSR